MATEAGADIAFLEGFTSIEQGKQVCQDLAPTPVMLNMVRGRVTPEFTLSEAQEMGFRLVIYPGLALAPVLRSVTASMMGLRETGSVKPEKNSGGLRTLFEIYGLDQCIAFDNTAGGTTLASL